MADDGAARPATTQRRATWARRAAPRGGPEGSEEGRAVAAADPPALVLGHEEGRLLRLPGGGDRGADVLAAQLALRGVGDLVDLDPDLTGGQEGEGLPDLGLGRLAGGVLADQVQGALGVALGELLDELGDRTLGAVGPATGDDEEADD